MRPGLVRAAVLLAALLAGGPGAAEPRAYAVDPAGSRIAFRATSRFMDAEGTFARLSGRLRLDEARPEASTGDVAVLVASLDTGIALRDNHLRSADFLDAARYPQASFQARAVRPGGDGWRVTGPLTIRGVTRPVTVTVAVHRDGAALRLTGALTLSRREFGVTYRSILNPIGDEVRVTFDLLARPEAP